MRKKRIILASGSPRRRELMQQAGFVFEVLVSEKEEVYQSKAPKEIVKELALLKAEDISGQIEPKDSVVVGADTVVVLDGKILGKPKSEEEAFGMIQSLQGRKHQVYTGIAVLSFDSEGHKNIISHAVCTEVFVCPMTEDEIREYMKWENVMDKAGAYGIQGRFGVYIEKIEGDYYNVVGLPISYLYHVLKEEVNR